MNRRRAAAAAWFAVLLAVLVTVGGCATPPTGGDWLSGRLSVKVDASAGQPARSLNSGFDLQGDASRGELRLTSPLGTLVATARWSPGEAVLVSGGQSTRFDDLDALSREALGEALPLRALPDWLRGRPWAGAQSRATPGGFEQLGWEVATAQYGEGRLDATRSAAPAVTVRARLETGR